MNDDNRQKIALVTGAGGGIGNAIVERLLSTGWEVVGLDKDVPEFTGLGFRAVQFDLLGDEDVASLERQIGTVDAIVHAAGFMRTGFIGELATADGDAMWRINLTAAEQLANLLVPGMGRGGRIVLIGSRTAAGAAGRSQYAAVKAALVGLARSWALELAPRGITVNVVAPAATETKMLSDPGRTNVPPKLPPIGRYIQPREVAAYVAFLLSEEAAAITGQHLLVCGGASL